MAIRKNPVNKQVRISEAPNREYKDSVFCDLFYTDETSDQNLLELVNAVLDTNYTSAGCLKKARLEDVLFTPLKNDVSVLINGQRLIMFEHQSTDCPNMPMRLLMYYARELEHLVKANSRYKTSLVKIPTPEFLVFYNGVDDMPLEWDEKLSDAFKVKDAKHCLELVVHMININYEKGHNILSRSNTLKEYSQFVKEVRKYGKDQNSLKKAVRSCISQGILEEYLTRKGSEVINMMMVQYDYDTDIRVKSDEAFENGTSNGINLKAQEDTISLHEMGFSNEDICKFHKYIYSKEQIQQWINEHEASLITL